MITISYINNLCIHRNLINVTEYRSGNQKKDNPEKLTTQDTEDEAKQSKNTTQPREAGNIGYTRRRKTKQKHNMCWTPVYANKQK